MNDVIFGIHPHKGFHTAVAVDWDEQAARRRARGSWLSCAGRLAAPSGCRAPALRTHRLTEAPSANA